MEPVVRVILEDSIRRDIRPEVSVTFEVVWLLGNLFFNADRPLECKMLLYRKQISKATNIVLLGRFETFLSLFNKSVVSWIKLFAFWAYGFK